MDWMNIPFRRKEIQILHSLHDDILLRNDYQTSDEKGNLRKNAYVYIRTSIYVYVVLPSRGKTKLVRNLSDKRRLRLSDRSVIISLSLISFSIRIVRIRLNTLGRSLDRIRMKINVMRRCVGSKSDENEKGGCSRELVNPSKWSSVLFENWTPLGQEVWWRASAMRIGGVHHWRIRALSFHLSE